MFDKLKALFFKPPTPKTPVRLEHWEDEPSGYIIVWSDDKKTQLFMLPDKLDHEQLTSLLNDNNYEPVEYFVNTY